MKISVYKSVIDKDSTKVSDIDLLLSNIKDGQWQDDVLNLRKEKDPETKKKLKKKLPAVTISGTFSTRTDSSLLEHSGFICMDIDHVDPEDTKSIICTDEHVYAAFTSCGGRGLAVLFRITPTKHADAFLGLSKYLFEQYNIVVDPSGKNLSRLRFVSFDPHLYINEKAKKFTQYVPRKENPKIKESRTIFVKTDFEQIISDIRTRSIDLTYHYADWRNIGFAISDKFGESGRDYFHDISSISSKYDSKALDRQYTAYLKSKNRGITIATFYWYCKRAGIQTYSSETREILKIASSQIRNKGMNHQGVIDNMKKFSEFDHELIDEVVPQVTEDTIIEDASPMELLENEILNAFTLRRNLIKRRLEIYENNKWNDVSSTERNDIKVELRKRMPDIDYSSIEVVLGSKTIPPYDPFKTFLDQNKHIKPETDLINQLSDTISSISGLSNAQKRDYIKKWYVSMIYAIHGRTSPLMLVLIGEKQGTGKTEFFRRLLPDELKEYHVESNLVGDDSENLLFRKLLIVNDEFGGMTVRNANKLKALLSSNMISKRLKYRKDDEDFKRLAILAGTSNEYGILNDPTGNRRIIPVQVDHIDHDAYNSIDKLELFMQAYHLYKEGYDINLNKDEVLLMNNQSEEFKSETMEEELLWKYYSKCGPDEGKLYKTSWIKEHIDKASNQRLNVTKLGAVLKNSLGKKQTWREKGEDNKTTSHFGYRLIQKEWSTFNESPEQEVFDLNNESDVFPPDNQPTFFDPQSDELPF